MIATWQSGQYPIRENWRQGQVCQLAEEYRKVAHLVLQLGRTSKSLTRAPFRLSAIHAIELYLNALLLQNGYTAVQVRGLRHDLGARAELAQASGLLLRLRTKEHLRSLSQSKEYLVTRYGPELAATTSQINRLMATLEEVAVKVAELLPKSLTDKRLSANGASRVS